MFEKCDWSNRDSKNEWLLFSASFTTKLDLVFVYKKSSFNVAITQMPIFLLFVSAGVLLEGAFSLWVSLIFLSFNSSRSSFIESLEQKISFMTRSTEASIPVDHHQT